MSIQEKYKQIIQKNIPHIPMKTQTCLLIFSTKLYLSQLQTVIRKEVKNKKIKIISKRAVMQ